MADSPERDNPDESEIVLSLAEQQYHIAFLVAVENYECLIAKEMGSAQDKTEKDRRRRFATEYVADRINTISCANSVQFNVYSAGFFDEKV